MKRIVLLLALGLFAASALASGPTYLVRVERQGMSDLALLREAGLPVVLEMRPCLFLEGDEGHLAWLQEHGYHTTILDHDPTAWEYVVVGLRPDSDRNTVESLGLILLEEENWVLLRVAPGAPLDLLQGARVFFTRLGHEPLAAPREASGATLESRLDFGDPDPLVQQIVDEVDDVQIHDYWVDLTENPPTGTRYSRSQGCRDASDYCHGVYTGLSIPAEYQDWNPDHAPNVIGTREGAITPEHVYIAIGHLDDLPSSGSAPGADDNASGSVWMLEAARAMQCNAFKSTIKYINCTGEEQGLLGSKAYAADAEVRGEDIRGVINLDMPGWEGDGIPDPENLDINYNGPSEDLGLLFADSAVTYNTGLAVDAFYCPSLTASDHYAFWQKGWKAICGITDNEGYCGHGGNYPYYHTSDDTIANCGDPTFLYAAVRTSVATLAALAEPFRVAFGQPVTNCDGSIRVVVGDRDLNTDPGIQETTTVTVWSTTEPTPESLVLTEEGPDSMLFSALLPLNAGPPVGGDGALSVAHADTLSAHYTDDVDCDGALGVDYTAFADVDCVKPLISGVGEENVSDVAATIVWSTDELSGSEVVWGPGIPPDRSEAVAGDTTSHQVPLAGLEECTVYYYEVRSADAAGNLAVDDSGGLFHRFETMIDFGSGLQSCHGGTVGLGRETLGCSDTLQVEVSDLDLNLSATEFDTTTVTVSSSTEIIPEVLVLVEDGLNTSRFTGSIATAPGAPVEGDGILQASDGDLLTATYQDQDDGTGSPATSFATAVADCIGPGITDLRVEALTNARATVRWTTSEPADSRVDWGMTPGLGETTVIPGLRTSHAVVLNQFDLCQTVYLRVSSTDEFGNVHVADLNGEPYAFDTWLIPGLYWWDNLEGDTSGWTLQGEWEVGEPQGLGGSSGQSDPTEAYNNSRVLGNDLSGQGAYAGDYEPSTNEVASTEMMNASSWNNTKLILHRRLNVGSTDSATIIVWRGMGTPIWGNQNATITDSAYSQMSFDISALADGQPLLAIQFALQSDGSGQYSGWNIDDVILKDGSLPDYDACGGCGSAPSFSGAASAVDTDGCDGTGVVVSWARAVAWGSGGTGTYAVYRDTSPDFTPSAANRIAAGLSGLSHLDTGAPLDQPLYYLVRAENDETCATGPNNGGVTDDNLVYIPVRDDTSQPPLDVFGSTLRLRKINAAHLRLTWTAVFGAARYHVYRGDLPGEPQMRIAEVPETLFEDRDELANLNNRYYLVFAADACGNEGP